MVSLLLAIIYLAFISLGLPDSLLGSIWSIAHKELGVSLSYMGYITIIISSGTVLSSLFADKLTENMMTAPLFVANVSCLNISLISSMVFIMVSKYMIYEIVYHRSLRFVNKKLCKYCIFYKKT